MTHGRLLAIPVAIQLGSLAVACPVPTPTPTPGKATRVAPVQEAEKQRREYPPGV